MTTGDTEETCGGRKETGRTAGGEGNMKLPRSVTTLSTIAIQAGQSLMVVSVLQSGSLVHLQLIQVHPGLCEIGSNQEESQTLIQEQQQLMEKLKKHEGEILAVVEKKQQTEQMRRKRRDEGVMEHKRIKKQEEEEEVHKAMVASLTEGWLLLLHLLQRREEVLTLAADFYQQAMEFAVILDTVEDLQSRPDQLTEVQLTYNSTRRGLLGKSLQVLTSSSILLQKLRRLQRTEDLQRRGGGVQEEEEEEELWSCQSSQSSTGAALRLEELVEVLQDRRRKADQAARLQLQQAKNGIMVRRKDYEDWKIQDQDLLSGSTSAENADLESESRTQQTTDLQPGSRSDVRPGSRYDVRPGFRSDVGPGSGKDLRPGSRSDVRPGFRSDVRPGFRSDVRPGSRSDVRPGSISDVRPGSRSDLKSDTKSEEIRDLQPGSQSDQTQGSRSDVRPVSRSNVRPGSTSDLKSDSKSEEIRDLQPGSRSEQTTDEAPGSRSKETSYFESGSKLYLKPESRSDLQSGARLDLQPGFRLVETSIFESGSRLELKSGSKPVATKNLQSGCKSNLMVDSRSDLKSDSRSGEETKDLKTGSRFDQKPESKLVVKPESRSEETRSFHPESRSDLQFGSRSEELQSGLKPDVQIGSRLDLEPACRPGLNSDSRSDENIELHSGSRLEKMQGSGSDVQPGLDVKPESRSEETNDQQSGSSVPAAGQQSMLGKKTPGGEGHAHQTLSTNQTLQLLSSCDQLVVKVSSWLQQSSSLLYNSSEAGRQLSEAEHTLNTHLQLRTQVESAGQDAENMKQILDQIRGLHTSETRSQPPSGTGRQLSPLKALTEQLKRGGAGGRTRTGLGPPTADPTSLPSPELSGRVDLVLKELQSLTKRIDSNLLLLQPFVTFLRKAQQVEEEMDKLREVYRKRLEEEEAGSSRKKKKLLDACWQETLLKISTCQELGDHYVQTVSTLPRELNLQSLVSLVQQKLERLKQEVNGLRSQQQIQIQEQHCRKYQERLHKTLQDLNFVSEMLDSCTLIDLGSALQTSRLLEHFHQARPHFTRLDAEVEYIMKSWETLSGVQDRLEVEESKGVNEEDLSKLLKLQERVKNKIHQSEWILDLSRSFHLTDQQLEALLQFDPVTGSTGSCGSNDADQSRLREKQIQSLFETASTLRTDICSAVIDSGWTCFRVEQLETRLVSLYSLCVSSLNEETRREDKLLTRLLNDDITQLRDSFKELKKRFSNLRFNYLKRNDRTRNTKAARNQLQQMDLHEEKLQVLRKRLQGVAARLGSEVKDRGVARESEDAVNELQRQMGEFERSLNEHQKTLEMTCRLQQAMEEYQFWSEDASATIARVRKFSSECRSTEAVSVLYRQFEKFVWPTVPQQEERISQITELAVRLHGVEEGRRYTEKTVSKHSDMMEAIRQLSDGLMELKNKLKLESLNQQNEDEEIQEKEEKERKMKENRKMKEQTDNRCSQEADMYELKETGHTPELTAEHDGKEVSMKRQSAANRKPPLQKSRSQEADRQTDSRQQSYSEKITSSYRSSHSFSLSCSPVEPNRRVYNINSQSQPAATDRQATPPPSVIGPMFSDIQREFQTKEKRVVSNMTTLQDASVGDLSEAQLQQQEVMTDDSLSNDEYDCASPDDISLPPLAETPESNIVQSDVEEGFCFSSHSVHISHSSHQSDHSGTGTATGAARQQRESSQTESCPTPPNSRHSSNRFRAEYGSFVQSPLTVPAQSLLTSTLCSILKTGKTSTANAPQSNDLSLGVPEPGLSSGSHHESNLPDSCSNKDHDHDVPEKRSPSQTDPLLKEHNSQNNPPQTSPGIQGKITQHVASKGETSPRTDPNVQVAELNHNTTLHWSSCCPQPFDGPERDLHKDNTPPQDTGFLKCSSDLHQDIKSSRTSKETSTVSKPQRDRLTNSSTVTQHNIFFQSSPSDSHCLSPQSETLPQINPVPKPLTDSVLHRDRTRGLLKSCELCHPTTLTLSQDRNVSRSNLDSRSGFDQDVPSSQTSKETFSVFTPQSSSLTTATTAFCPAFPPNSHCTLAQTSINLRSQQENPFSQSGGGLPAVHAPVLPELNSISNISLSSSNRFSSEQNHHTVYSFHESLTSSCTQQCMHDPGMTPSNPIKPVAPPPPKPQTQALAPQADLHVTSLSSPPHLLTPDLDPNICQPMAIREEIRLTPQIQWPPFPAPPQAQAESLPQGKATKPVPPCFTRPLSRATVMEGSPVTLEVEVTGHPEPRLTWCKDGEAPLSCEDGKHFLFIPEASDSDEGLNEPVGDDDGEDDKWLLAQVFDIVGVDWHTWFGT